MRNVRTVPGEGVVMVQSIVASLLDDWIGVDPFLLLVRSGALDTATRDRDFTLGDTAARTVEGRPVVPPGAPNIKGVLTWRRKPGKWSLDMNECRLGEMVRFWSSISPGVASIRFDGVVLPDTIMTTIEGRRLIDVADQRHITDPDIIIRSGRCTPPSGWTNPVTGKLQETLGMTQFNITVPSADYDDPVGLPWAEIAPIAVRTPVAR